MIFTRANIISEPSLVRVESHLSNGLTCFTIVGLSEMAVRDSRERLYRAILNPWIDFPDKRITIKLAFDDMPKRMGSHRNGYSFQRPPSCTWKAYRQQNGAVGWGLLCTAWNPCSPAIWLHDDHYANNSTEASLVRCADSRMEGHLLEAISLRFQPFLGE